MTKKSDTARRFWPDFRERYGIRELKGSEEPHDVWTTKWGVKQFGWPATCPEKGCGKVWCVYVQKDGKGLNTPRCSHSPGKHGRKVYADDPVIRKCQSKKHWP